MINLATVIYQSFSYLFSFSIQVQVIVYIEIINLNTLGNNLLNKSRGFMWRRKWQTTPIFLPGEFHGQRSLEGYSPWGCKELEMTEWLTHTRLMYNFICLYFYKFHSLPELLKYFILASHQISLLYTFVIQIVFLNILHSILGDLNLINDLS